MNPKKRLTIILEPHKEKVQASPVSTHFAAYPTMRPYRWPYGACYGLVHLPTRWSIGADKLKTISQARELATKLERVGEWNFSKPDQFFKKVDATAARELQKKYTPEFKHRDSEYSWVSKNPLTSPTIRRFDGKLYHYRTWIPYKLTALAHCRNLRNRGFYARWHPENRGYSVWIRPKPNNPLDWVTLGAGIATGAGFAGGALVTKRMLDKKARLLNPRAKPSPEFKEKLDEAERLEMYIRRHGVAPRELSQRDRSLLKFLARSRQKANPRARWGAPWDPQVWDEDNNEDNPLRQFCCSICGACAPKKYLPHGKFEERISWLRRHYKTRHPGMWPWRRKR